MAIAVMSWLIAIPLLGMCTGLRTMTPIALVCWYAHLGYLPVGGTWAFWVATAIAVGVFTLFAAGEYVGESCRRRCRGFPRFRSLRDSLLEVWSEP